MISFFWIAKNGISENQLEATIYRALEKNLTIKSIFTHYKSADILSSEYFWQKAIFRELKLKAIDICEKLLIPIPSFHSSNSNALFRDNNFDEDFCRIGLAGYGYIYEYDLCKKTNLLPVLSLWGKKLVTKQLKKGEKVGYGGSFTAKEDMNIATYDIGYGDGFLRIDENQKIRQSYYLVAA